jgi:hypothetical protein
MRSARQKAGGVLAAILLYVFVPADLHAQTDKESEAVATSLAICKDNEPDDNEENKYQPCEQYIDANIANSADPIKWMIEEIDHRKDHAREVTNTFLVRDEIVQWILVILSLLTAISTAIAKGYPKLNIRGIDFALAAIVLFSMVAAVTSISAYYQFDEYRRVSQNLADDLTELETDIHFGLLRHGASRQGDRSVEVNKDTIND